MLPFGVTVPATVPQGSEIPDGLMNNPLYVCKCVIFKDRPNVVKASRFVRACVRARARARVCGGPLMPLA
jgi:hypothetical protein